MTVAQSSTGGGDFSASRLTAARDRLARKQQEINDLREKIGPLAAEQYRTGAVDPSVQLFLSSDPDEYLDKGRGHRPYQRPTGSRTAGTGDKQREIAQERADAADRLKALTEARAKAKSTDLASRLDHLTPMTSVWQSASLVAGKRCIRCTKPLPPSALASSARTTPTPSSAATRSASP
ncbi:hypothetical protein ACFW6M_31445 [Streptomyces nigra]|uniref:hypothetical protein n=1 Tax=Streptomyces nigra TaxID=1827580 RepID=UPI00368874C8